jgi:hypothetical protein
MPATRTVLTNVPRATVTVDEDAVSADGEREVDRAGQKVQAATARTTTAVAPTARTTPDDVMGS